MIKNLKTITGYIFAAINWHELLMGIASLLVGLGFSKHAGYVVEWPDFLRICVWFLLFKNAMFCLDVVLSDNLERRLSRLILENPILNQIRIRDLFWILTLAFLMVSVLPIFQLFKMGGINELSVLLICTIILGHLVFKINTLENVLAGFNELVISFTIATLLPALTFCMQSETMSTSLIFFTLPLFLQIVAFKLVDNLNFKIYKRQIVSTSIVERIGHLNSLYTVVALVLISCFSLVFPQKGIGLVNSLFVFPIAMAAMWFAYKSIKIQHANWDKAVFLIILLPYITAFSILFYLWSH